MRSAYIAREIFDGEVLHQGKALLVDDGRVEALISRSELPLGVEITKLDGMIAPGFVDLQVNGGGGALFNDETNIEGLRKIANAHARLGSTTILPTLITDSPEKTRAAIEVSIKAIEANMAGIAGLHLEGPHLSRARKGAHDAALIRPMNDDDMALLLDAAARLPVLKVTLAPENASMDQIARLAKAGILVSLGHSDAGFDICAEAMKNGARCVTHLFNAMSQLGSREPGLVGAALVNANISAGLIADMIHVHPKSIALAMKAKGASGIFLVSDAMAVAGTDMESFELGGRVIRRETGRLTLEDGTLAGADLDLAQAVRNMMKYVGLPFEKAMAMAGAIPAGLIGANAGHLRPDASADFVLLAEGFNLQAVWQNGAQIRG